jgi:hypothetical protein
VKSLLATAIEICVNKGKPLVPPPEQSATEYLHNIAEGKNKKKKEQERIENRLNKLK